MNSSFFGIVTLTAITVGSVAFSPISAIALGIGAPSSLGTGMHGENSAHGGSNKVGARAGGDVTTNVHPDITGTNQPVGPVDAQLALRAATDSAATTHSAISPSAGASTQPSADTSAVIANDVRKTRKKQLRHASHTNTGVEVDNSVATDVNGALSDTPAQLGVSVPVKATVGLGVEARTPDAAGR